MPVGNKTHSCSTPRNNTRWQTISNRLTTADRRLYVVNMLVLEDSYGLHQSGIWHPPYLGGVTMTTSLVLDSAVPKTLSETHPPWKEVHISQPPSPDSNAFFTMEKHPFICTEHTSLQYGINPLKGHSERPEVFLVKSMKP